MVMTVTIQPAIRITAGLIGRIAFIVVREAYHFLASLGILAAIFIYGFRVCRCGIETALSYQDMENGMMGFLSGAMAIYALTWIFIPRRRR